MFHLYFSFIFFNLFLSHHFYSSFCSHIFSKSLSLNHESISYEMNRCLRHYFEILYAYFNDTQKVDYVIEWCGKVARNEPVENAIIINDISFSHKFTRSFIRVITSIATHCRVLYLLDDIRNAVTEQDKDLAIEIIDAIDYQSPTLLDMSFSDHELKRGRLVIVPNNEWLRHNLNGSRFLTLNVSELMQLEHNENVILEEYYKLKKKYDLRDTLRCYFGIFENKDDRNENR